MKKIIKVIALILLMLPLLMAQQIVYNNVLPITWDTHALIAGSTITYEIIRAPRYQPELFEIIDEISAIEYDVPLVVEGEWIVGVRTVRTVDSIGERYLSEINWSDINGEWTPDPFVVRYFVVPEMVKNLRLQ